MVVLLDGYPIRETLWRWENAERMPRVCKGVIKIKGGNFEESQI